MRKHPRLRFLNTPEMVWLAQHLLNFQGTLQGIFHRLFCNPIVRVDLDTKLFRIVGEHIEYLYEERGVSEYLPLCRVLAHKFPNVETILQEFDEDAKEWSPSATRELAAICEAAMAAQKGEGLL